jgi:hypothetical protein
MKLLIKLAITLFFVTAFSSCSTIGKLTSGKAQKEATPSEDITRPPQMVVNTKDDAVERNPDETVSYDEWQKQTEADDE